MKKNPEKKKANAPLPTKTKVLIGVVVLLALILIGLVATLIMQSSSATTGVVVVLGAGGLIDLYTAVALILGANIGTTITAQLAAFSSFDIAPFFIALYRLS